MALSRSYCKARVNSAGSECLLLNWSCVTGRNLLSVHILTNSFKRTVFPTPLKPCTIRLRTCPSRICCSICENLASSPSLPARYGGCRPEPGLKGFA